MPPSDPESSKLASASSRHTSNAMIRVRVTCRLTRDRDCQAPGPPAGADSVWPSLSTEPPGLAAADGPLDRDTQAGRARVPACPGIRITVEFDGLTETIQPERPGWPPAGQRQMPVAHWQLDRPGRHQGHGPRPHSESNFV
jgi:hypothetical protein